MNLEVRKSFLDFPEALNRIIKEHQKWRRSSWGQGAFVAVRFPDSVSANTQPYLYMRWVSGGGKEWRDPWTPSDEELFSDDWEVFDEF